MSDLMGRIELIARSESAQRVVKVQVRIGALSHLSPDHFKEHFERVSIGTLAENAQLDIEVEQDVNSPHAQEVILESVEIV